MTAAAAALFPPDVATAFEIFLGRAPNPANAGLNQSLYALHRMLARSAEFRASPRAAKTRLGWPLAQVFVSKRARILYCPIGKNACTLLKSEVARSAGVAHAAYMAEDIHFITDLVNTGLQLSDYPRDEVSALTTDPGYLRTAVLRDPQSRLLSAYIEKFVMGRLGDANIHHTRTVIDPVQAEEGLEHPDYDRGITFRQFIDHVTGSTGTPLAELDPHWRPQAHYLAGMSYDRLFRIDQVNDLLALIEARSGVTLDRQARNVTGSGTGADHPGAMDLLPADLAAAPKFSRRSFFDAPMRQKVETAFADDYALLQKTSG